MAFQKEIMETSVFNSWGILRRHVEENENVDEQVVVDRAILLIVYGES